MKSASTLAAFAKALTERIDQSDVGTEWFERAALELFQLQYDSNAAYRRLCLAAKVQPERVQDWRTIPAVPTVGFKELELTSIPAEGRLAAFHSSGTTEQRPSRHFHHSASLALYERSLLAGFRNNLLTNSGVSPVFLSLTPSKAQAQNSSLVHMFDAVVRRFGKGESEFAGRVAADGTWDFDVDEVRETLKHVASANDPVVVLGTAFLLVHLLEGVQVALPEGSRVLETGGYKGRSRALPKGELYAGIRERLGVPESAIVSEYGMCELSSQAYAQAGVYSFSPWAKALIVSPETGRPVADGETGLVRVVDLANVWSVAAVQTEDLGVRRGDGFELLGRAATAEARGCSLMSG